MERSAMHAASAGATQDERRGRLPAVVRLGDHVDDLVEGAADEVHELELGDRAHARERRAIGRAHDRGFGDGRIDHALGAEGGGESVRDLERAAVDTDVFADAEDAGIALHLFPESLPYRFEICRFSHFYLKWIAASVSFNFADPFFTFGVAYFGLIGWQFGSQ